MTMTSSKPGGAAIARRRSGAVGWTLEAWLDHAWRLENQSRASSQRYEAIRRHIAACPADEIAVELDADLLASLLRLMRSSKHFGRPPRGHRGTHWSTPAIVRATNQLARLDRADIGHNHITQQP